MKNQLIWVFEWRKSVHYWWSYILFSPECKELTSMLDTLLYRWGVPPVVIRCVHWTMQMWVLQTWIIAQGVAIVMMMGVIASQIISLTIVYSIVYPDSDQRKHQSSALLAFVRGIHWALVNSPHKWPVTRKMFPFDDVIMCLCVTRPQWLNTLEPDKKY